MAKIGDDLYIESLPEGLRLRTINSTDSAYCTILFKRPFFTYFNHDCILTEDSEILKCKISMKSALNVFKSPSHMDKQVEMCELKFDMDNLKLIFQLRCKHGIVKTHFISVLECTKVEASYIKDETPNRLTVHHKIFSDAISNFQTSEDQVTFEVSHDTFCIRNYVTSDADMTKITRTQFAIKPVEFEEYCIGIDAIITFSMREFKSLLSFAEAVNLSLMSYFEIAGKPIVFTINNNSTFIADFVMATEKSDFETQTTNATQNTRRSIKTLPKNKIQNYDNCLDDDFPLFNFVDITEKGIVKDLDKNDLLSGKVNKTIPLIDSQNSTIETVFRRCFETTIYTSGSKNSVIAEDSDND